MYFRCDANKAGLGWDLNIEGRGGEELFNCGIQTSFLFVSIQSNKNFPHICGIKVLLDGKHRKSL